MVSQTDERIAERTAEARQTLPPKVGWRKRVGEWGLMTSNTIDRLTGWSDDERLVFAGGTAKGLLRGAILGLVVAFVAIGSFPAITAAGIGGMLFVGAAAVGAAGFGIYEGQKALDKHLYGQKQRLSDHIAEKMGTVPKEKPPVKTAEEIGKEQDDKSPTFFRDLVKKQPAKTGEMNR